MLICSLLPALRTQVISSLAPIFTAVSSPCMTAADVRFAFSDADGLKIFEAVIHQRIRILKPVVIVQNDSDEFRTVPFGRCDETSSRSHGVADFHTGGSVILKDGFILIVKIFIGIDSFPFRLIRTGTGDFAENIVCSALLWRS